MIIDLLRIAYIINFAFLQTSLTLYGIVVYHAADCLPAPFTQAFGPFSNPHKLLLTLEKLE